MNCICSFDGIIKEIGGKFIYTGGKNRLRHINRNVPFGEFIKIMEDVCSNDKVESYITVKHMISGILCDVVDDSDYQAMFMSYQSNSQTPLHIWIVKDIKSHRGQPSTFESSGCMQDQRTININVPQREATTHAEDTEPYVPVRIDGDRDLQSAASQRISSFIGSSDRELLNKDFMAHSSNDSQPLNDNEFVDILVGRCEEERDSDEDGDIGAVGVDVSGSSSNVDNNISDIRTKDCASYNESSESEHEFHVGQLYPSRKELMDEVRTHAIFHRFELKHVYIGLKKVIYNCISGKGCNWRLYAKKLDDLPTFQVMKYNPKHTCLKHKEMVKNKQASSDWVAKQLFLHIKDNPNCTMKHLQLEVQKKFGIDISYKVAWNAKNIVLEKTQEDFAESYQILVSYLDELKRVDPCVVAKLETQEDGNRFLRFFWTYGPTIRAYKNNLLRRMVIVHGTILEKARGTLITAITVDADDHMFPLAFAIVDAENDESWTFFLQNLRDHVVGSVEPFLIQSDMHQSLLHVVPLVFQNAIHTYCIHKIVESLPGGLEEIKNKLIAASLELSVSKFESIMSSISVLHPMAYKYVNDIGNDHWAELYIQRHGRRYGIWSKDHVESWNNMIRHAINQPITNLVEAIRANCSANFNKYMESSLKLTSKLTSAAENWLIHQTELGRSLKIVPASMTIYQVISNNRTDKVDLEKRECSCNWWQVMGLPCCHALKCIATVNLCMYDFCEHWFTKETYAETYKEVWQPLREKGQWVSNSLRRIVNPPAFKLHSGQPKNRRIRLKKGTAFQIRHCSRCKGPRHNRSTCSAELVPPKQLP